MTKLVGDNLVDTIQVWHIAIDEAVKILLFHRVLDVFVAIIQQQKIGSLVVKEINTIPNCGVSQTN